MTIKPIFLLCIMFLSVESTSPASCPPGAGVSVMAIGYVGAFASFAILKVMRIMEARQKLVVLNTNDGSDPAAESIDAQFDFIEKKFTKIRRITVASGILFGALLTSLEVTCIIVDYFTRT